MKQCLLSLITALFFSGFIKAQVVPQTGSATLDIPIVQWKDNKSSLNSTVALSYNSGNGLMANDVASSAGQGWNVLFGGVITRLQVGAPDDQRPFDGNGLPEDIRKYPAGYLYDTVSPEKGCPGALKRYPIYQDKNHLYKQHNLVSADKELDKFAFQINGKSGMFVLGKGNGNKGQIIGDSKWKVWYDCNENLKTYDGQGVRTTIATFYVQDETGQIYKFQKKEFTKVLQTNYCDANLTQSLSQPKFEGGHVYHEMNYENSGFVKPWVVTSWYLSEIFDPFTKRRIVFTYEVRNINSIAGNALSYYKEIGYSTISHIKSLSQTPAISEIAYPDGYKIAFFYGKNRVDLTGDKILSYIDATYQGRYISRHELKTSYLMRNRYGEPSLVFDKLYARLYLLAVTKTGIDLKASEQPTTFEYYLGSGVGGDVVPEPFSYAKDIWGFYNGSQSMEADGTTEVPLGVPVTVLNNAQLKGLCFIRNGSDKTEININPGYAKNGLIKQVSYSTGGALKFDYEQNKGKLPGLATDTYVGGVHVSRTTSTDGGYSNGCGNPVIKNYSFVTKDDGSNISSLWGIEMPLNTMKLNTHYSPELKKVKYQIPLSFSCTYKYQYPGILLREQATSLTGHQQFMVTLSKILNIVSAVLMVIDVISLCLDATPAAWVAVILDIVASVVSLILTCTAKVSKDTTSTVCYNSNMLGANPLPTQFSRVVVTESSGGNGRTVMEFTNHEEDFSDASPNYGMIDELWSPVNPTFSMRQRFSPWAYGLPKRTIVFDSEDKPLKETVNRYKFIPDPLATYPGHRYTPIYPSCKCLLKANSSQRNTDWQDAEKYNSPRTRYITSIDDPNIAADIYSYSTGRSELVDTYERTYKKGSTLQSPEFLEVVTHYEYYNLSLGSLTNHEIKDITITQSNGDINKTSIKYNVQISDNIINDFLLSNNVYSLPVSSTSILIKDDIEYLLSETVTEFIKTAGGEIKPYRNLAQQFTEPQDVFDTYYGPDNASNPSYTVSNTYQYDAKGGLTEVKDEGGRVVSNIYGYNGKYIIATVVNASLVADNPAYTSFEVNGELGGWKLNGGPSATETSAVTGKKSQQLVSGMLLSPAEPMNVGKNYILSFWSTAQLNINGAHLLLKNAPVINGYTYYEYRMYPGGTPTFTINGSGYIDELRLYPENARMRTQTFDLLLGSTSECDENNRIVYFNYDDLGRLKFIKDANRSVLKMYEYNIAKGNAGCTSAYQNSLIKVNIQKDDCLPGFEGSFVPYTIVAGKYVSNISPIIVDLLVQNEIENFGQAYANQNGQCLRIYYNQAMGLPFTRQTCPDGYLGATVTYAVPYGKYTSTINQQSANDLALAEINANGQSYANSQVISPCTPDPTPNWESTGVIECELNGNGGYTGYQKIKFSDINPNSPTYGQTQWQTTSLTPACTAPKQVWFRNLGMQSTYILTFTNKLDGLVYLSTGTPSQLVWVIGAVPAGVYDISITSYNSPSSPLNFTYQVAGGSEVAVTNSNFLTDVAIDNDIEFRVFPEAIIYQNKAISMPFTKQDCGAGYVTTPVTYTVLEGEYTSTVSQQDADDQASNGFDDAGQDFANIYGVCELVTHNIYLTNNSGYNGATFTVDIDGIPYDFPANGEANVLAVSVTPGTHVFNFNCGATGDFSIDNHPPPVACGNNFSKSVNQDITLSFFPVYSYGVNLITADALPSQACCHGCGYSPPYFNFSVNTATIYANSGNIGTGTAFYMDEALTQPISANWVYFYSNGSPTPIYPIVNGVVSGSPVSCP